MAETNPPLYMRDGCTTAAQDRQLLGSLVCTEGVVEDGLAVTTSGGMSVTVGSGSAFVQGDDVQDQGMYHVHNDGNVVLTIPDADPVDPRIDLVVARVHDPQFTGADPVWALEVVAGAAAPTPAPPLLPPSAIALAEVRTNAGGTTVTVSDVRANYQLCPGSILDGPGAWTTLPLVLGSGSAEYRVHHGTVELTFDIDGLSVTGDVALTEQLPGPLWPHGDLVPVPTYIDPSTMGGRAQVYVSGLSGVVRASNRGGAEALTRLRGNVTWTEE